MHIYDCSSCSSTTGHNFSVVAKLELKLSLSLLEKANMRCEEYDNTVKNTCRIHMKRSGSGYTIRRQAVHKQNIPQNKTSADLTNIMIIANTLIHYSNPL